MVARSVPAVLQGMNKVSTAVQLRFDVRSSASLPEEVKTRLLQLAGSRATQDGILIIEAQRFRTQEQNRVDAFQRLALLVRQASIKHKTRKKTKPTGGARLRNKAHRSSLKRWRQYESGDWEE